MGFAKGSDELASPKTIRSHGRSSARSVFCTSFGRPQCDPHVAGRLSTSFFHLAKCGIYRRQALREPCPQHLTKKHRKFFVNKNTSYNRIARKDENVSWPLDNCSILMYFLEGIKKNNKYKVRALPCSTNIRFG